MKACTERVKAFTGRVQACTKRVKPCTRRVQAATTTVRGGAAELMPPAGPWDSMPPVERRLVRRDNEPVPIMVDPERTPRVAGDSAKAPAEEPRHQQK